MEHRGKLELTWVGKYEEKAIEPRILVEDPEKSYGDPHSENMLIHGDNLIALQALQQDGDFGKTERLFRSNGTLISFETEQRNSLRCG